MRFIRTLHKGQARHALLQADGTAVLVIGDWANGWQVTAEPIEPRQLLAPIQPRAIIGIAQNYRAHAKEMGAAVSDYPVFFMKLPTAVQDPEGPIVLPRGLASQKVDYEVELAVVIGKSCKNVRPEDAMEVILGFTIANDVSARDWQKEWGGGQFCRGKTFDTFCPLGPVIVSPDELGYPPVRRLWTELNGEIVQDSTTDDLIFDVPKLVSFISGSTTLEAGTVILTGTPSGVGAARQPPRYLQEGDTLRMGIDGIGVLENNVVEEVL